MVYSLLTLSLSLFLAKFRILLYFSIRCLLNEGKLKFCNKCLSICKVMEEKPLT